jgi:predicted nucleic acid-binding protein
VIIDTGPLVALLNRRDQFHQWAVEQSAPLDGPFFTCDAVLSEACFRLEKYEGLVEKLAVILKRRSLISEFFSGTHAPDIFEMMKRYENVPMSFADGCLVSMVENTPGSVLFTLDRDFTIYRQQRRRLIPLIAPFSR